MKCMLYKDYGSLSIEEIATPQTSENELLIKVMACGICGSELETFKNRSDRRRPPLIMGHEFAGIVAEEGPFNSRFRKGDKVVSHSLVACGHCSFCLNNEEHLCESRKIFGMHRSGALAEYVTVPEDCLLPIPEELTFREACLTEPLANGVHIYHLTKHLSNKRVVVIGAGPIGLLIQQVFQSMAHAEVIVCDLNLHRLKIARQLGAIEVVEGLDELEHIVKHKFKSGHGADIVVDAVGLSLSNKKALEIVRPGGAVVLIGLHENATSLSSYDIILSEKQVLGTYAARNSDLKEALELMSTKKIDLTSWISYYNLDESVDAFYSLLASSPDIIKAVIVQ